MCDKYFYIFKTINIFKNRSIPRNSAEVSEINFFPIASCSVRQLSLRFPTLNSKSFELKPQDTAASESRHSHAASNKPYCRRNGPFIYPSLTHFSLKKYL